MVNSWTMEAEEIADPTSISKNPSTSINTEIRRSHPYQLVAQQQCEN